eukprot:CAMPEP_0185255570 /NCGR_PEP_ID=MMETSP1359-20130426/4636_1 /TAXON_ID=552665 /ORGANISM="Bigelowiella longifila, Strain CCMP242" /LENGTH=435 /DNA_ID=CAMNT_0027839599 /DNA_START=572 /DNA_END=1879 /DNA_ORIENTATION=+
MSLSSPLSFSLAEKNNFGTYCDSQMKATTSDKENDQINLADIEDEEAVEKNVKSVANSTFSRLNRIDYYMNDKTDRHGDRVSRLIAKAEGFLAREGGEFRALEILEEAHRIHPSHSNILDAMANIYLESQKEDAARELLEKSIRINPNGPYEKWFSYAELLSENNDDERALEAYMSGIRIAERKLNAFEKIVKHQPLAPWRQNAVDSTHEIRIHLASAHSSVAQLFLSKTENAELKSDSSSFFSSRKSSLEKLMMSKALRHAKQAVHFNRNTFETHAIVATVYLHAQNRTAAIKALGNAFEAYEKYDHDDPTPTSIILSGIKAAMELGLTKQALAILEERINMSENIEQMNSDNTEEKENSVSLEVMHLAAQCSYLEGDVTRALSYMYKIKSVLEASMLRGKQLDKMEESILQDVVEWITETHAKFPRIEINENK